MTGDQSTAAEQISPPESSDFINDAIAGLSSNPRTLPCKYFYDERGAALFQKICDLPEYYITRTEIDILDRNRAEIASHLGPNIELIGLGTGAGTKTRILIEALETPAVYIPVDISEKQLRESTANFRKTFPEIGSRFAQLLFGDIHGDINRRRLQCFDENPGFCAGTGAKPD